MKKILRKSTALLLTLSMIFTMFPLSALAAEEPAAVTGGVNGYAATMQPDASTKEDVNSAFVVERSAATDATEIGGSLRSASLNGKVWADKSVVADTTNKAFDVTLSALGQTYAGTSTTQNEVAFDVMFILDISGSMVQNGSQKGQNAVSAINSAMKALLDGEGSEHNRVGLATLGSTGSVPLGMGHYTSSDSSGDYLKYSSGVFRGSFYFTIEGQSQNSTRFDESTYTQAGIAAGIDGLIKSSKPEDGLVHVPVVILLTDGQPTHYTTSYSNVNYSNSGSSGNSGSTVGAYTVRTAVAYKQKLAETYAARYDNAAAAVPKFFTIGQDLEGIYEETLLNPTVENVTEARREGNGDSTARSLANELFPNNEKITDEFSYADASFTGQMDEDQLNEIFNTILDSITSITGGVSVGESTGGRDKMNFYETLGDGVQFTGDPFTLTVPTYSSNGEEILKGNTFRYSLEPRAQTTVQIGGETVAAGTEITAENGPAYLEAGGIVEFVQEGSVGVLPAAGGSETTRPFDADENDYDKSVQDELTVQVRLLSSGKRQLQVSIPSKLMAYNILISETENGSTTITGYYQSAPITLDYSIKMRPDQGAGSYLISEPSQSYLHFIPSSAKSDGENYDMPYYWNEENASATDPKDPGYVAGSASYVSSTMKDVNNDVRIYLGNNGLYKLDGKDLTFHLIWEDHDNQDGKRPDEVKVTIYRQNVVDIQEGAPAKAPDVSELEPVVTDGISPDGGIYTLTAADLITDDDELTVWQLFLDEQPFYAVEGEGGYLRYWAKISNPAGSGYDDSLYGQSPHDNGVAVPDTDEDANWYCFWSTGSGDITTDAKIDVQMKHEPETVSYTIEKKWDVSTGDASNTEESVSVQLYANGKPVDEKGVSVGSPSDQSLVEISQTDGWKKTLTLPKYANGAEISYTPVEQGDAYTAVTSYSQENGNYIATITNYSNVDKTSLTAVKSWDDNNDQDGKRPDSVDLKLTAEIGSDTDPLDDEALAALLGVDAAALTEQVSANNNWTAVWDNLPKTSDGQPVAYSAVETTLVTDLDYETEYNNAVDGYVFVTNTHDPTTRDITISKSWSDGNNQDGLRPASISGMLYQKIGKDGAITPLRTFAVDTSSADGAGSVMISDLPEYSGGQEITYYVSENAVGGYELSVASAETAQYNGAKVYAVGESDAITLTNTHAPATESYSASFIWDDNSDRERKRPEQITVTLNSLNGAGTIAKSYTIVLKVGANGVASVETDTLPAGAEAAVSDGKLTVTGLPSFAGGTDLSYAFVKPAVIDYDTAITDFSSSGVTFTLSYEPQPLTLTFNKVWQGDDGVAADMRPTAGEYARYLTLKADGTDVSVWPSVQDNGKNTYTVTYSGLEKYTGVSSDAIVYTVTEAEVPNYTVQGDSTLTLTGPNAPAGTQSITNVYDPVTYESISVTKAWNDTDSAAERPTCSGDTDPLDVRLYKSSEDINSAAGIQPASVKDNGDNTWTYVWENVLKQDKNGNTITYVAYENSIPEGYSDDNSIRSVSIGVDGSPTGTLVNVASETAAGTLTITKNWDDEGYEDSRGAVVFDIYARTDAGISIVQVQMKADGENGGEITATNLSSGQKLDVTDGGEDRWGSFSISLPVSSGGSPIKYYLAESTIPAGYTAEFTTADGDRLKPVTADSPVTLTSGGTVEITATNTFVTEFYEENITVTKVWSDADGSDKRPSFPENYGKDSEDTLKEDPLNIRLYPSDYDLGADAETVLAAGIAPTSIEEKDGTWVYTWEAGTVPKTVGSKDITYKAYENTVPSGYDATVRQTSISLTSNAGVNSITNVLQSSSAAAGDLTVEKIWNDENYEDHRGTVRFDIRGVTESTRATSSILVEMAKVGDEITAKNLSADGALLEVSPGTQANSWGSFTLSLPLTAGGEKIKYYVTETVAPDGYKASFTANGETVDENNRVELNQKETTVIVAENIFTPDKWTLTYNANGGTGDVPKDGNTYTPADNKAKVKERPAAMTYEGYTFLGWTTDVRGVITDKSQIPLADELYTEGEELVLQGDATLYAVWAVDRNGDGKPDYEQKTVKVSVVWDDDGNRCGVRPGEISFKLKEKTYTIGLSDTGGVLVTSEGGDTQWIYEIPDLFDEDETFDQSSLAEISATAKPHEDSADTEGYTASTEYADNAYTITMSHRPETTSHDVTKLWNFGEADFTTGSATIQLLGNGKPAVDADGTAAEEITFKPGGGEDLTWDNLPKYEGGKLITYHAVETRTLDSEGQDVTSHFSVAYDWSKNGETTITNTYTELRSITLLYSWDDGDNAAGLRPQNIKVQLYQNVKTRDASGTVAIAGTDKVISEANGWNTTWDNLNRFSEEDPDMPIQYEARVVAYTDASGVLHEGLDLGEEDSQLAASGYSFSVMAFGEDSVFVMDSALDNGTSVTVNKSWEDADNRYGTRPGSVWINLLQDEVVYQSAELSAGSGWTHTWNGLPEFSNGQAHVYTVEEIPAAGYTSSYGGTAATGLTVSNSLDALTAEGLKVTFVYNNGDPDTTQNVSLGGKATEPDPAGFSYAGHDFAGWYLDPEFKGEKYDFDTEVTDDIILYAKWVTGGDDTPEVDDHKITFIYENASAARNDEAKTPIAAGAENSITVACRSDFSFIASANSGYILNTPTKEGSAVLVSNGGNQFTLENITGDITVTVTATRQSTGGGGGGGGGGGTTPSKPELEKGDHFAYIIGYEDGTIRANNSITRAEVATIFFRLLTDESRDQYWSETNSYSDVSADEWYNNAISTLSNAGIITGYPDGTFRPDASITRAELATIAAKFDDLESGICRLTDIGGHWAEQYIVSAYSKGWVDGYPDGTYRPDNSITRAEVVTLVNHVLERAVDTDGMLDDMITWSDNLPSAWYYEAIQEATNSHDYDRLETEEYEDWTKITEPRDWTELEH